MIDNTKIETETDADKKAQPTVVTIDEKINTKLYENRMLFFNEEITDKSSLKFIRELYALYFENASPITIKLATYGGYFKSGSMMAAAIEEVKQKSSITCDCSGAIASGGIDVMLPCTKRRAFNTTTFLLHHHSGSRPGRFDAQVDHRKEDDMIAEMRVKALAKYSNMNYEEAWAGMDRKEWWMSPEEMLSYEMLEEVL